MLFYLSIKSSDRGSFLPYSMRTHSGATNTNKPGTSHSHAITTNPSNPPLEPTLDDVVTIPMNASANSAHILQAFV